jgi:Domain of unknown function (DUF2427)
MRQITPFRFQVAAWLLVSLPNALSHGDDHGSAAMNVTTDMNMSMNMSGSGISGNMTSGVSGLPSYFAYEKQRGVIVAHIALMVLAWAFVLPIGMCRDSPVPIGTNLTPMRRSHV